MIRHAQRADDHRLFLEGLRALLGSLEGIEASATPRPAWRSWRRLAFGLLPVFFLCERADVGGVSYPVYPPTSEPLIFIYDGYPGGVGYARAGASLFPDWLRVARDLLRDCACKTGCPRCILSPKCGNGNQHLDKMRALRLAEALLERLESSSLQRMMN